MLELPGAVLFSCTYNAVRSVMAASLMRHFHGRQVFVDSCGVRAADPDGFVIAIMDEFGLDISLHEPKTFDDLEDDSFDLIVTLSPEAHHKAMDMTRTMSCDVVFWNTFDATIVEGSRDMRLDAYRQVREQLKRKILTTWPMAGAPTV